VCRYSRGWWRRRRELVVKMRRGSGGIGGYGLAAMLDRDCVSLGWHGHRLNSRESGRHGAKRWGRG
jgi:hypothetical protein